jgi:RNA polymerase sigma-70 factor, ECF subfamily
MPETSFSLLERLRSQPDDASWRRLLDLYTPLVRTWLRRHGLADGDAEDLVQEVLAVVVRELPHFEHNRRPGAFRGWLRAVVLNRWRDFWRARRDRPVAAGGSESARALDQLEDPNSALSQLWDREHDQHALGRLLQLVEPTFAPSTWRAFRRVVLEGAPPAAVAAELGTSVNAVCIAKSRVLQRLRQEARGLLD